MQWKCSYKKCFIGSWFILPEDKWPKRDKMERIQQMESLAWTLETFQKFIAGDFTLHPPLAKRVTVLEAVYPYSTWRELIFSEHKDIE